MQNVIDRARDIDKFGDIVLNDPKSRVPREMAQVGGSAGDQVIDREYLPAAIEEVVAKVRPQKSRPPVTTARNGPAFPCRSFLYDSVDS